MQQIPSHNKVVRMMFQASCEEYQVEEIKGSFRVKSGDEVKLSGDVWKDVSQLLVGDLLQTEEGLVEIRSIDRQGSDYILSI